MAKSKSKTKIVVLGSAGFLGSCLYENFLQEENYEVRGFSKDQIDLTSRESTMKLANFLEGKPVVVMAVSALAKEKSFSAFQKEIAMYTNLTNPELISKIRHFILISSTAIYGHHFDQPIVESSPSKPDDYYSLAKLMGEMIFKRVCADCNVGLTIMRPGILYGRGDIRSPLFRFINFVRADKPIEIHGDGSTRLVWLYNLDAFCAVKRIVENFKTGDYNIIAESTSLVDLTNIAFRACGKETGVKFVSSNKISPSLVFDLSKFKTDFPGFEFTKLKSGVEDYFNNPTG